jgi:hypothetical protein
MVGDNVCPRCNGLIPNNQNPGAYPGALSRADNKTEICSACGEDEALGQFFEGRLASVEEWPVAREFNISHPPEAAEQLRKLQEEEGNV